MFSHTHPAKALTSTRDRLTAFRWIELQRLGLLGLLAAPFPPPKEKVHPDKDPDSIRFLNVIGSPGVKRDNARNCYENVGASTPSEVPPVQPGALLQVTRLARPFGWMSHAATPNGLGGRLGKVGGGSTSVGSRTSWKIVT